MTIRKVLPILAVSAAALAVAGAAPGHVDDHGPHAIVKAGGEKYDLSDLADGETRTFGTGEREVRATRTGDSIAVTVEGTGDSEAHSFTCSAGEDECSVIVGGGDEGVRLIVLRRRDDGEQEDVVHVMAHGAHGSGEARQIVVMETAGEGASWASASGERVLLLSGADARMFRCPEGDATLHAEADDEGPFLCPKHNIIMDEVKGAHGFRTFEVRVQDDGEDD